MFICNILIYVYMFIHTPHVYLYVHFNFTDYIEQRRSFLSIYCRLKMKMASYNWISKKVIPFLKKSPNMGSKELQELEEKYDVTLGYSTVHLGHEMASKQLFDSWEESFGYLFNFKAEIELRMPGSVVEIDVIN